MRKSRKQILFGIVLLIFITIILLGLTYAYYKTKYEGNPNEKTVDVTVKKPNVEIIYSDDNSEIVVTDIEPGDSIEKEFTVTNKRNTQEYYSIILDNFVTDCTRHRDWKFELKRDGVLLKEGIIPIKSKQSYMMEKVSIEANEVQNYTVKIIYLESDEVQNDDIGKSLSLRINIDDPIVEFLPEVDVNDRTLLAGIKRENILSETLTKPGKEMAAREYMDLSFTKTEYYEDFSSNTDQEQVCTYGDSYKFDKKSGEYTLIGVQTGKYSDIYQNLEGKYLTNYSCNNSSTSSSEIYRVKKVSQKDIYYTKSLRKFVGEEEELSYTEDDYGISYYYRGLVTNNYVNFNGMCWRIVRIQGDKNIKLILMNQSKECNEINYDNDKHIGDPLSTIIGKYTYGSSSNMKYDESNIPKVLDDWLTQTSFDISKLNFTKWCNDISGKSDDRVFEKPTLKCEIENYSTNVIEDIIGLLSADEAALSGLSTSASYSYLNDYVPTGFWTMSSGRGFRLTGMMVVSSSGMDGAYNNYVNGVRPCIILQSSVTISSGDGSRLNPYVIN